MKEFADFLGWTLVVVVEAAILAATARLAYRLWRDWKSGEFD